MPHLSISLFGPLLILRDGQPMGGFAYQKARALLIYLVLEAARPHSRDELVGLLWPDLPDAAARTNLRQALADLRKVIGDESQTPPYLLVSRENLQFNPASDYTLDAAHFTTLVDSCKRHLHRHVERCPTCLERMQQAVADYRGELVAGFMVNEAAPFEEWLLLKREAFHQRALTTLIGLAHACERRQQHEQAIHYTRRQLELDPWREEAHQQLMRLYAKSGQRSAALAQYQSCRRMLAQELGVEPTPETVALYEAIRAGKSNGDTGRNNGKHVAHMPIDALPHVPTPLIGRTHELAELGELLANPQQRLITITGPGGIGKTRLALAAAAQQAESFRDGAVFVALDGVTMAEFLPQAILTALAVALAGQQSLHEQLRTALQSRELLLILDNYEQLLPDVTLIRELLRYTPGVTLLVTSREDLALQAEQLFKLDGLSYQPVPELLGAQATAHTNPAAVELFIQRVRQRDRHFAPTTDELNAIVRICRVAEGMPLAVELAAAATAVESCNTIAAALGQGTTLATPQLRDRPARHHTMQAAFAHSWQRLSAAQQACLMRLALFRGGFELDGAQAVASATLNSLTTLLDKSLLRQLSPTRFTMHELVRQFAESQLAAANQQAATAQQHVAFFTQLAEVASAQLQGAEQKIWLERLDAEYDNLRAALTWAVAQAVPAALRLVAALGSFWRWRGYLTEGRQWAERALEHATPSMPYYARALMWLGVLLRKQNEFARGGAYLAESLGLLRAQQDAEGIAQALRHLGWYYYHSDGDQAIQCFAESIAIFRRLGNKPSIAQTLTDLARLHLEHATDYGQASVALQEALSLCRETGDANCTAHVLMSLADLADLQGEYQQAMVQQIEALALLELLGNKPEIAAVLSGLAETSWHEGNYEQARDYAARSVAILTELDVHTTPAVPLHHLGLIELLLNELAAAQGHLHQSLHLSQQVDNQLLMVRCLAGLGGVAIYRGEFACGVQLLAAATSLFTTLPPYLTPADRAIYQQFAERARAALPATTFASAWASGAALSIDQAISYTLADVDLERKIG